MTDEPPIPSVPGHVRVLKQGAWGYVKAEETQRLINAEGFGPGEAPRVENVRRCGVCGGWAAGGRHDLQHFTGPDGLAPSGPRAPGGA